jgi:3'-phosphoadenosine 5'-phosphosulfate sulfotransferase (PAPS reductase)/FAD synthetase
MAKRGEFKTKSNTSTLLPFDEYDRIIVSFSGGKDSLACLLHLLEIGAPQEKIELWHQAVDGRPGASERFFDWPVTEAYCNAVATVLGVPIRYQWREGGMLGEILKGELAPDGPYALHSSVITAYFRWDPDGRLWVTRGSANASFFPTTDEAEAWRSSLPPEGTIIEQFISEDDLADIEEEYLELKEEAETGDDLDKADRWYERKIGALPIPPMRLIQVTSPRPSSPIGFELYPGALAAGDAQSAGGKSKPGVRLQFPDPVVNLRTRWCSAHLKIDVSNMAIRNDPAFDSGKFLFVTGERREESANRSRYAVVEKQRTTKKSGSRRVDQWRPVIDMTERQVWELIARWRIRPHPGYYLGWGRLSCLSCIFGDTDQWASVQQLSPDLFSKILHYERRFGKSIQRGGDVAHQAGKGVSFVPDDPGTIALAMGHEYPVEYARLAEGEEWVMPIGAFKRSGGPL